MKVFFLLMLVFFNNSYSYETNVVLRNKNFKSKIELKVLSDLISNIGFEGKYFKIVKGKSDDAIEFNENDELVLKAATVYYHLTIAREYFVKKLNSSFVSELPQLVIRIEHTNQFSELGHFANDNLEPQYNNALSIPAGKGLESRQIKPWGKEIWFRPSKKVHLSDLNIRDNAQDAKLIFKNYREQTHMTSFQRFLASLALGQVPSTNVLDYAFRSTGASIFLELFYLNMDPLSKLVSRKWYWLETALVPEIIYHEYAHIALSDHLELLYSSPVNEGMADFFAGKIANSNKLATKIKKYNTFNGKRAKNKKHYLVQYENNDYANIDFVFGLLWSLNKIVGEDKSSEFVYLMRNKLQTSSKIKSHLTQSLLMTCDEICAEPLVDKVRILQSLHLKDL